MDLRVKRTELLVGLHDHMDEVQVLDALVVETSLRRLLTLRAPDLLLSRP